MYAGGATGSEAEPSTLAPNVGQPDVLADSAQGAAFWSARQLWVLHTRARHEKRVAETLAQRAVAHYLPLVCSRRTYGRRVVDFQVPLFPGYVFLGGDEPALEVAWRTNRIAQVLRVADVERLRTELEQIAQVLRIGAPVDLYPGLKTGRRCRVVAGPLMGTEGVVIRWRNASRLYLAVTFIGQSAAVEIDAAVLEAVE